MNQSISVSFKATDSGLTAYLENIKKKSSELTNDNIRNAIAQTDSAKEQLRIIKEQINLIEKRAKLEADAKRNLIIGSSNDRVQALTWGYENRRKKLRDDMRAGLISYEDGRDAINATFRGERADKDKTSSLAKEELFNIRDQLKETKLQTALSREQITEAKVAAREQLFEIRKGNKTLTDVYKEVNFNPNDEEKLTIKLLEEELSRDRVRGGGRSNDKLGFVGGLLTVDNFNKVVNTFSQLTQTQNGYDQIANVSRTGGQIFGAIAGGIIAGVFTEGLGVAAGAAAGASIGGALFGASGDMLQREQLAKQRFLEIRNRFAGITGGEILGAENMESVGIGNSKFIQLQTEYARRRGYSLGSGRTTIDALYGEKGYGIDSGTSAAIIEMQRSSRESNRNLAEFIGGVLEKGRNTFFANGDNTFLNEFLNRFSSLQKELLRTQTHVATGTSFDILSRFNSMGGMFDARDPRSYNLISSINSSLANPSSDGARALEYYVLRQQNPGAGLFEIRKRMQQGLGNPGLLRGVLKGLDSFGGSDDSKMFNLAGLFPNLPAAAIERLYNNRSKILSGNFSQDELRATLDMKSRAEGNTTPLEVKTAKIENGVLDGSAVKEMADAIHDAVQSSLSNITVVTRDGSTFKFSSNAQIIKRNKTIAAENAARDNEYKNQHHVDSSGRNLGTVMLNSGMQ